MLGTGKLGTEKRHLGSLSLFLGLLIYSLEINEKLTSSVLHILMSAHKEHMCSHMLHVSSLVILRDPHKMLFAGQWCPVTWPPFSFLYNEATRHSDPYGYWHSLISCWFSILHFSLCVYMWVCLCWCVFVNTPTQSFTLLFLPHRICLLLLISISHTKLPGDIPS